MTTATLSRSLPRPIITWLGLVLMLGTALWLFDPSALVARLGVGDFIAYWSAGRQIATGENPYDADALLRLQRPLGWGEGFPNMMYYPPWTLPFVLPFGAMPFAVSRLVWMLLSLGLVIGCAELIWRYYGGPSECRWLAWAISLAFIPTLIVLRMGQIGPLLLLGIIGFMYFEKRGQDFLAGAALLLPAIKPQLVYLFGVAVLVWAIHRRRWSVLTGGLAALAAALTIALLFDPDVLSQYRYALAHPPSANITPTIGAMLRLLFGEERTWLQYLPSVAGLVWFAFYWWTHRQSWVWGEQAPILVMVSFLTAAYGAWVFDLVVLLLPILHLAFGAATKHDHRTTNVALACFGLIDGIALALNLTEATYPAFIWMTPAILGAYLLLRRKCAVVA